MDVSTSSISGRLVFTPNLIWMTVASSAAHSTPRSQHGIDAEAFVQDSLSRSAQGVIRGLHLRPGSGEAKIVRCSYGEIFDVVVDLRPGSPTFSRWRRFGCGAIPVSRSMSQPDVRTVSRHLPILLTSPIGSTARTTRAKTSPLPSMTRNLRSPGHFHRPCSRIEIGEQSLLPRRWA
jgi:dTDP-4-dehydrorhamnose 3,5-epimerase